MRQQDIQVSLNGYPYHVLIVDDDPVHRALEREILDSSKYAVFETSSGREALDALRSRSFDAVLLDKQMPGMDGDEVCRCIRGELGLGPCCSRLPEWWRPKTATQATTVPAFHTMAWYWARHWGWAPMS